jgi:hypothetical protein
VYITQLHKALDVCCQMDIVASPTTMSADANEHSAAIENNVRKANLAPSDSLEVDVGHDRPDELNKPPLLKHV